MVFLVMYTQCAAMDAAQAQDLLGRIMELSTAATTAATTANQMLEAFNSGGGRGAPRFGDGALATSNTRGFQHRRPCEVHWLA